MVIQGNQDYSLVSKLLTFETEIKSFHAQKSGEKKVLSFRTRFSGDTNLRTWCLTSAGWWIQSSPFRVIAHHCLSSLQSREKVCNLFLKIVSIFCCASYKRISQIILHLSFSLWDVWPLRHIKRVLVSL